jgi:hypothetical protein
MPTSRYDVDTPGKHLAITAESLYLLNLLLFPGLAFLILLLVYVFKKSNAPPLADNHLAQTVGVSMIGGAMIVGIIVLLFFFLGLNSAYTWTVVVLYFTLIHSSLILLGVIGLVKAMSGEHFIYPVIGKLFSS